MPSFATYLHPHTCYTSKSSELIPFAGYSFPYYSKVRQELQKIFKDYPSLPVRKVEFSEYLRVHAEAYLNKLLLMASDQPLDEASELLPPSRIECKGLEYCLAGYSYGLGGMIEAIDWMKRGVLERAYCFSLLGHHAHKDWGHGYCLLNPLATAARYAQTQGFNRILIVDWDIHHGDGTQSIFSNDPNIYCISIHNGIDFYMTKASDLKYGTTSVGQEVGHCNIPILSQEFDDDLPDKMNLTGKFYRGHESLDQFKLALEQLPWTPDLILIFSGYNSHMDDYGYQVTNWTNQDFQNLSECVLELATRVSCPVLSSHGGGHRLSVTIPAAVSHVEVLANYQ